MDDERRRTEPSATPAGLWVPAPDGPGSSLRVLEVSALGALAAWLLFAALVVGRTTYDALDTIAVARFFSGVGGDYLINRAPLFGLMLAPIDALTRGGAHTWLDVRPYHLVGAVLHLAHLGLSLRLIYRVAGRDTWSFVAWLGCVPTFVFFSYAPFLSHDLIAGTGLLALLVLLEQPAARQRDLAIVIVGAACALVKHTFALFLIASLVVFVAHAARAPARRAFAARLAALCLAAGALTWLVLVLALGPTVHAKTGVAVLLAPVVQIEFLLGSQPATAVWWTYPANLPAYGLLAVLLVAPAAVLALRGGGALARATAVLLLVVMSLVLLSFHEVRYLAFAGPTIAVVITPLVRSLARAPAGRLGVVLALAVSFAPGHRFSALDEALRLTAPFYREDPLRGFLRPVAESEETPVLVATRMLSFRAPRSAFLGDRFHRWFDVASHHLALDRALAGRVVAISPDALSSLRGWPPGSWLLTSSHGIGMNEQVWPPALPAELDQARNLLWASRDLDGHVTARDDGALLDAATARRAHEMLAAHVAQPGQSPLPLRPLPDGAVLVPELHESGAVVVRGFARYAELPFAASADVVP